MALQRLATDSESTKLDIRRCSATLQALHRLLYEISSTGLGMGCSACGARVSAGERAFGSRLQADVSALFVRSARQCVCAGASASLGRWTSTSRQLSQVYGRMRCNAKCQALQRLLSGVSWLLRFIGVAAPLMKRLSASSLPMKGSFFRLFVLFSLCY